MRRHLPGLALALALLLPARALAQKPEAPRPAAPPAVFPIAADIVLVDVVAVNSRGEPFPSLGREDFEVLEGGERRPIILFRAPEASGRAVAFLFEDAFASGWHVARVRDLVERAQARAVAGDRILVIAPASRVATSAVLPQGARGLAAALGRIRAHSEASEHKRVEAVLAALEALHGHPGPRALVVVGPAFPYRADSPVGQAAYERVMRASQRVAASVFFLKWGEDQASWTAPELRPEPVPGGGALGGVQPMVPMELPEERETGLMAFDAVASDSGGFAARGPTTWSWSLDRIFARARAAYLLGIPSVPGAQDGRYHPLDVRVTRGDVRLYARKGYFAPRPPAPAAR